MGHPVYVVSLQFCWEFEAERFHPDLIGIPFSRTPNLCSIGLNNDLAGYSLIILFSQSRVKPVYQD